MLDMATPAARFLTDTSLFQVQERKSIRLQTKLSFMIFKLMIGLKCLRLKKEDITILVAISTINSFMFSEVFKTQTRSIHAQSKESILI